MLAPQKWSVGSLLLQHEGKNFSDPSTWDCNNRKHPTRNGSYGEGISVSPLEVVFHKAHWANRPPVMEREMNEYSKWKPGESYKSDLPAALRLFNPDIKHL